MAQAFLEQFAAALAPGAHAVLVWDNSGSHTAQSLRCPANVTLVPLPPYAPELNPIENLWHYLRDHHWSDRNYADRAELESAACAAWRASCLDPATVSSVTRCGYAA